MTQEKINRLLQIVYEYARLSGTTSRMVDEAREILREEKKQADYWGVLHNIFQNTEGDNSKLTIGQMQFKLDMIHRFASIAE